MPLDNFQSHLHQGEHAMTNINFQTIEPIIKNFKNQRVLVLGDIMQDKYLWGRVNRISPEAPVPVVAVQKDTSSLGGAGNVSHNLESLGAFPILVGIVGEDEAGTWIKDSLPDSRGVFTLPERPTAIKTRVIAHHQQVVRVDQEEKKPIPEKALEKIIKFIHREDFDGIIISDYNKGIVSKPLLENILPFAWQKGIPVFVDPKTEHFEYFSSVTLITPNHFEAERIVYHPCDSDDECEDAARKILALISAEHIILKRGEKGMTILEKGKSPLHIPTIAKEVYDVTGAGDTVIAAASLALLSGASLQEAAVIANCAAGVVVAKLGTATLTAAELLQAFKTL
jgi:rfaE bifunctional protein kinase chain/domain